MNRSVIRIAFIGWLVLGVVCSAEDLPVDFETQIQPIFQRHCLSCHGPDKQASHFRVDQRSSVRQGGDLGGPAILAGSSEKSPLYQYVSGQSSDLTMPPSGEGPPLTEAELALLKRWIDQGANWPDAFAGDDTAPQTLPTKADHWSFRPPVTQLPPLHDSWIENGIDRFILQRLRTEQLEPSPPADRVTLIRRIYLDLLGIPPRPEEVLAFVQDQHHDAYARLVDQVLARPQLGERWAQHWLDVVRYGESDGFETNRERETAYHYRDYVIHALNSDLPYDQFIVEQIAGDRCQADVATGYLVAGPHDIVKSPDVNLTLMQRQDELADIVNTTGATFLGLTVGCARCHNHKFDPIMQTDFYALQAVFAGVEHGERVVRTSGTQELEAQLEYWQQQRESLQRQLEALPLRPPIQAQVNQELLSNVLARYVKFTILATNSGEPCIDELEVWGTSDPKRDATNVALATNATNVALATNDTSVQASGTLPGFDIHQLKHIHDGIVGNSHSWISATTGTGWVQLEFKEPYQLQRIVWGRDRTGAFTDRVAIRYRIEASLDGHDWQTVAHSDDRLPMGGGLAQVAVDSPGKLSPEQQRELRDLLDQMAKLDGQIQELRNARDQAGKAFIGNFHAPPPIHRLHRGDPLAPRETVAPNTIVVLGNLELTTESSEAERRMALAKSIAHPRNPLTARVIVNRLWQHHFGRGLVATPSDFGTQGIPPTHPELLDYLANYLVEHEWSLKAVHRLIVLSQCYQQSNRPRTDCLAKDADCRWLWRYPPHRLDAEAIRDSILAVCNTLDPRIGGHGFYALEVIRENVHHYYPKDTFDRSDFRRMIYAVKIRQERDGEFGAFDCPDGGQVVPNRSRSTTPLQAMNLLNSQFILQQSEAFADELKRASPGVDQQIQLAYQRSIGRDPDSLELDWSRDFVSREGLAPFCRVLLNCNELLFIP